MIKELTRKFILIAICSVGFVFLAMIISLNTLYYLSTVRFADRQIDELISEAAPHHGFGSPSPFIIIIQGGTDGEITDIDCTVPHIIMHEDVADIFSELAQSDKERGFKADCRFRRISDGERCTVYLAPLGEEAKFGLTVFLTSAGTALTDFLIIGALIVFFSSKATRPIIRREQLQRQFITDAGHELKTPISIISASADVLNVNDPDNEWIASIKKQSERMSSLVSDLILLSKTEEGFKENGEEFSLTDAVWDFASDFASLANTKQLTLENDIEDDVLFTGDPVGIGRLISILLDNAFKYTDPGGTISVFLGHERHTIVFSVKNTYDLQNDDDLDRLFERFYRADSARARENGGSGIGLSIARSIVEAHGGTISAHGQKGKYIQFTVRF